MSLSLPLSLDRSHDLITAQLGQPAAILLRWCGKCNLRKRRKNFETWRGEKRYSTAAWKGPEIPFHFNCLYLFPSSTPPSPLSEPLGGERGEVNEWLAGSQLENQLQDRARRRPRGKLACIIFRTIIDYSFAAYKAIIFSLMVSRLNIREVRGGGVLGLMGREFMCFRYWVFRHPTYPP